MRAGELLAVVAVVAAGAAWLHRAPKPTQDLQLELPPGVTVLQQQGKRAVLQVDMRGHGGLDLKIEFDGPSKDWSFHLGDSMSNNGYGGDGGHSSNDAELHIVNGRLDVFACDRFPGRDKHLLKGWPLGSKSVFLHVGDGLLRGQGGLNVQDPYLFALKGQEDPEGSPNYDLFIGINQVVAGGRTGSGVSGLTLSFTP